MELIINAMNLIHTLCFNSLSLAALSTLPTQIVHSNFIVLSEQDLKDWQRCTDYKYRVDCASTCTSNLIDSTS